MGTNWETTKIFLSNISNNEIIPDENFPDYGSFSTVTYTCHKLHMYVLDVEYPNCKVADLMDDILMNSTSY